MRIAALRNVNARVITRTMFTNYSAGPREKQTRENCRESVAREEAGRVSTVIRVLRIVAI